MSGTPYGLSSQRVSSMQRPSVQLSRQHFCFFPHSYCNSVRSKFQSNYFNNNIELSQAKLQISSPVLPCLEHFGLWDVGANGGGLHVVTQISCAK